MLVTAKTTETMAMQGCYCHYTKLATQRRTLENLSFSGSISVNKLSKNERTRTCDPLSAGNNQFHRLLVKMRQTEMPASKYGTNGKAVRMVGTNELVKRKRMLENKVLNGSATSKVVRKNGITGLNKTVKSRRSLEELKVLATDEGFSWANENYSSWQRSIDVWSFVASLRIRIMLDNAKWTYFGGFTEAKQKSRRRKTASWLRKCVLQLGPTFIKLGQLSSTRSDLFPREFVDELAKLQDMVPAFSPKKARKFIESELGAPINILFEEFEDRPIAAASLGQVHRAILHNGEKVVIKVQRPGLKKLFDIDLKNLKLIAEYFQRSETFGGPLRDWIGIYEECKTILYQEIDYINEGKNADRFRRDFRNIKWVRIPLVYWDYTALKVLTMEYVPGIKIDQVDTLTSRGYDRLRISSRATEAYLIQILKTGFFHADPHPGNLAIDVDEAIIYYDFGMMGQIKSFTRERLLELFYAIYEKDSKKVMQRLIDLGALQPTGDLSSVRRSVQFFLDHLLSQAPDQEQTLSAIGEELLEIRQKQRTAPQLVEEIRKQADDATTYTMSMPYRVQRIEEFTKQLEAGDLKLRVRVLESERAARKATGLQMATMYTVLGGTLLNLGITMSSQGNITIANGSFIGAGIFMTLFVRSMQRVKMLDKFEKMI
ncbi:Protein ACTIVITY OF BC1 COMPLEX KINASE 7, chloroplastic [Glycine max]|nr:Protein ACTIVITY OF BC1 COMPLEX KINASE 7, chloroplastic [Glycine max]